MDLRKVFPEATSNKTLFRKPTYFEVKLNGEPVRFNLMPRQEVAPHLTGLKGYVASQAPPEEQWALLDQHINRTRTVLGLVAQSDFEDNPAIWDALFRIAHELNGFVFAYNSVILSNRVPLVGPLREKSASDEEVGADLDEDEEDEELMPPTAERVAQRALVMGAVVCRGFIEADAG